MRICFAVTPANLAILATKNFRMEISVKKFFIALFALAIVIAATPVPTHAETCQTFWYVDNVFHPNHPVWVGHNVGNSCGTQEFTIGSLATRRTSGSTGTISFDPNEAVLGGYIQIPNLGGFEGCYLSIAPTGGTVTSGVVNPWGAEIHGQKPCDLNHPRVISGKGATLRFSAGDNVLAYSIQLDNGQTFGQCLMLNAPTSGTLTDGVRNPTRGEQAQASLCH